MERLFVDLKLHTSYIIPHTLDFFRKQPSQSSQFIGCLLSLWRFSSSSCRMHLMPSFFIFLLRETSVSGNLPSFFIHTLMDIAAKQIKTMQITNAVTIKIFSISILKVYVKSETDSEFINIRIIAVRHTPYQIDSQKSENIVNSCASFHIRFFA